MKRPRLMLFSSSLRTLSLVTVVTYVHGKEELNRTILSAVRSTFATHTSASLGARHAAVSRTEVHAFRHLVAMLKQILEAFTQVLILVFLVLYSPRFKYRV